VQGARLKVKDAGIKVAGEKRAAACRAGFTLVEMIMVIVILGIVGLILGRIINAATRGYQSRAAMKELLHNLEKDNPKVRKSLFHALRNVREEYLL